MFNFCCTVCDYKTHKKHHLDRHLKSHLKSTPFVCPICGFKSGRKDNLKQHIEKRHCSGSTSIAQLEERYPRMYSKQEAAGQVVPIQHAEVKDKQERPEEEQKQRQRYSVEERFLDQKSIERLYLERQEEKTFLQKESSANLEGKPKSHSVFLQT